MFSLKYFTTLPQSVRLTPVLQNETINTNFAILPQCHHILRLQSKAEVTKMLGYLFICGEENRSPEQTKRCSIISACSVTYMKAYFHGQFYSKISYNPFDNVWLWQYNHNTYMFFLVIESYSLV